MSITSVLSSMVQHMGQKLSSWLTDNSTSVHSYGVVGDGVTDDTDAIQRALDTGRNIRFLNYKKYRTTRTLNLNISTLRAMNFQSQTIQLCGAQFVLDTPNDGSWMGVVGWPLVLGTRFIIEGGGARVSRSTSGLGDGVALIEGYGNQVWDIDFRNFKSGAGVHLYVSDPSRWCESMLVRSCRGSGNKYGVRSSVIGGDLSASFDQTRLEHNEFNLTVPNAVGFSLDGFHGRTMITGNGVWAGEEGATNTVGWYLNGQFSNAVMTSNWADGGATAENTIQFGPGYSVPNSTSSMASAMTLIGTGVRGDIANYMKLPPGWQWRLKVLDSSTIYGAGLWRDESGGTGDYRVASPAAKLQFEGQFYAARGTTNTLYKREVTLPLGVKAVRSVSITPMCGGDDNLAKSAGQCGEFNRSLTSVTFYMIPTNVNGTGGGEGCFYNYSISLEME